MACTRQGRAAVQRSSDRVQGQGHNLCVAQRLILTCLALAQSTCYHNSFGLHAVRLAKGMSKYHGAIARRSSFLLLRHAETLQNETVAKQTPYAIWSGHVSGGVAISIARRNGSSSTEAHAQLPSVNDAPNLPRAYLHLDRCLTRLRLLSHTNKCEHCPVAQSKAHTILVHA